MSQNNSLSVRDELEEIRVGSKTYSIDLLGAIFINKKKVRLKMQLPITCPISNKEMVFDRGGKWLLRHQQSNYLFEKSQILMSFFRKFYVLFQPRGCDKLFHELNIHLFKKSLWIFVLGSASCLHFLNSSYGLLVRNMRSEWHSLFCNRLTQKCSDSFGKAHTHLFKENRSLFFQVLCQPNLNLGVCNCTHSFNVVNLS